MNRLPLRRLLVLMVVLTMGAILVANYAHADTKRDVFAFCGVEPTDVWVGAETQALVDAGVTASMGPCRVPPADYSVVSAGSRYADPSTYADLVSLNTSYGLKTIVYDARLWSPSATERATARALWQHYGKAVLAIDLGDEYPKSKQALLRQRWDLVQAQGFDPYTNMLPWDIKAGASLPNNKWVSFDNYEPGATARSAKAAHLPNLMCAINAGNWTELAALSRVTPASLTADVQRDIKAGCNGLLIFTAGTPQGWHGSSITTNRALALALKGALS